MTAAIVSGHREVPPYGVAGGLPGQVGRNYVERADGRVETLTGRGSSPIIGSKRSVANSLVPIGPRAVIFTPLYSPGYARSVSATTMICVTGSAQP